MGMCVNDEKQRGTLQAVLRTALNYLSSYISCPPKRTHSNKLRQRFGLQRVALLSDRGILTQTRIEGDLQPTSLDWITALRHDNTLHTELTPAANEVVRKVAVHHSAGQSVRASPRSAASSSAFAFSASPEEVLIMTGVTSALPPLMS